MFFLAQTAAEHVEKNLVQVDQFFHQVFTNIWWYLIPLLVFVYGLDLFFLWLKKKLRKDRKRK